MKPFYRFIRFILRQFFDLFYRCKVYGAEHPIKGGAIIAPNHTSFFDPPIIAAAWPEEVHFIAKESLFNPFYMNWLLTNLNAYPLQENAHDIKLIKKICHLIEEGKKVVIFPEGERSSNGNILKIKSGVSMIALKMKCPIIPAYIEGAYEAWPRNSRVPNIGCKIKVFFGKPIIIDKYLHLHKKEAQESITRHLYEEIKGLKLIAES